MRLRALFAYMLLPLACLAVPAARADVGRIPALYTVSSVGGFTYKIPIEVPAGPRNVGPKLALVYDSTVDTDPKDNMPLAGTGSLDAIPAGAGWVLEGLSMIQRTNKTVAEDGQASSPAYDATDAYALDGNRLRLTSSGNYGQDGSTYQTELADFSLITAHGNTGYGPDHWTVQGKDGLTYEYGNTPDSQVLLLPGGTGQIRDWLLDKVSDAYGNSYTITYGPGASGSVGTAVPTMISWTPSGSGSTSYNYTIKLTYTARGPDEVITGYAYGKQLENDNLLHDVTVSYNGTAVRYYLLNYALSQVTQRSLLSSIEECSDSTMTHCLTPTGFSYDQGAKGVEGSYGTALTGAASVVGAYDFNGDGRSDILYVEGSTLWVAFSTGSGFNQVDTGIPAGGPESRVVGHLVSRSHDDILAVQNGTWYYYTWNGSGFTGTSTGIPAPPSGGGPQFAALADVNGDGLPDLVTLVSQSTNGGGSYYSGTIATWFNTSSGGVFSLSSSGSSFVMPGCGGGIACEPLLAAEADVNGDGKTDLLVENITILQNGTQQPNSYALLSQGTGYWTVASSWSAPIGSQRIHWNDDRCDDFVLNDEEVETSACNGAAGQGVALGGTVVGITDWNGDGLDDVLVNAGGVLGVQTSTGDGASPLTSTSIALGQNDTVLTLDVNGDGLPDIAVVSSGTVTYYLHNAVDQQADLLSSVTDGNGNQISPSYTALPLSTATYTPGTGAQDPESDWEGDLWVVQQLTASDGIGGTYTQTYGYSDARWNRLRGFEGFKEIDVTDSRSGEVRKTSYDLLFPETGMVSESDLFQSDGSKISTTKYTNTDDELEPTQYEDRHFPYAQEVTTDTYEVNAQDPSYNGKWITHSATNYADKTPPDAFGNFTSIDTTITDEDSGSPYSGEVWETTTTASYVDDTSAWCGTLPNSIAIAKTVPSQAGLAQTTITHTTTYARDSSYCRAQSLTEDAGQSAFDITRQFAYDSFGNVKQVQISGSGFPTRTWTYNWGATGQFVEQMQDPVAYADGYEEKIGYDYGKGIKTSDLIQSTSGTPDAPQTKWTPDDFGRITQESFPDGTTLNWTYTACSQTSCNGYPNAFEVVAEIANGSDGSTISDQDTYLDSFGRTVATSRLMLDGSSSVTEREYDQYGNVIKQSVPCNNSGCQQLWTSTLYDALNRPTSISSPDPSVYASPGNVTTLISYMGRKTSITNAKGQTTSRIVDVTGALRQTLDDTGYGQAFTVDADGNVVQANETGTSGNFLYSKTYDYGGEGDYVATMKDRALGSWSYAPDALGDVLSYQDAKGQQFKLTYDGLGRMTEREDWTNDATGIACGQGLTCETDTTWQWGVTPGNHDVGQLDEMSTTTSDGTYAEQRQYDADGRLNHRLITIPGDSTYEYSLFYNPQGLLSSLQFPAAGSISGLSLAYSYQNGALAAVKDASAGTAYWQATAPAAGGPLTEVDGIGQITTDTLGNGIVTERWLTPAGGLPSKIISGPGAGSSTVQNQTYSYDVLGNVTQRQDSNGQGLTESFPDYDGDNRLQESTLLNSSTNTTTTNLSVSYNPDGSISQKTEAGGTDTPVGYSVHWTSYNYPQSISATLSSGNESATFDYGPDRQRWRMVYTEGSGSETTEYIGGLMEKVTSSTGSSDYRYYVYGGNGLAAVVDIAGSTVTPHYVLEDQEGSISSLLNSTGSIAAEESFTAFGNRREASTWSGPPSLPEEAAMDSITRQGFTGQTVLAQMGLNHMNGRVEDAVTGTFLSPDPYVTDPGNTQDYYRYAYVYNDPLTYTDPSGFDAQSKCNDDRGCASGGDGSGSTSGGGDNGGGSQSPHMVAPLNPVTVQGLRCDWCASPNVLTLVYQYSGSASYGASHFGSSPGKTSSQQQSNPVSPTVLPTVTVTATSPLQQVTTTAQYEYPLSEAPLGDGLLDLVRQILGELSRPPHEVLSPQDLKNAGINFQTGHYINRVGPENVGPVEDTAEGIVNSPDFVPGTSACFTCNGVNYEMRTYVLPDGTINVGTIFPIE